jgi:hypothetical protein
VRFPYLPPAPADTAIVGLTAFWLEDEVTSAIDLFSSSEYRDSGT